MPERESVFIELLRAVDALLATPPDNGTGRPHTDVVADLLGSLASRMHELHAQRQAEARRFHDWLAGVLQCPLASLAGQAAIEEYWKSPAGVEAILSVIERNRPRLTAFDVRAPRRYGVRNDDRELVIDAYDTSMNRLRPILKQIDLTDRLIDQIVYRLYGMSPEEVAVVERQSDTVPADADEADAE